eukprot:scaffold657206_cov62-Prasinocladus_malaysianus.AAC.1
MPDGILAPGADANAVAQNSNPSQDFASLSGGAKFGIHTPYLNYQMVALLHHFEKTYCGAQDWKTG